VLVHRDGRTVAFMTAAASKHGIHQVMWVFEPSKIAAFVASRSRFAMSSGVVPDRV
jgi:RNA polymerase sigma-70 factor (ECF subfamily)